MSWVIALITICDKFERNVHKSPCLLGKFFTKTSKGKEIIAKKYGCLLIKSC